MKQTFALLKIGYKMWLVMALLALSFNISPARAEPAIPPEFYAYLPAIHNPYPAAPAPVQRIAYSSNWTGELMQYNMDTGAVTQLLPDHFMAEDCWKFSSNVYFPKLLYLLMNPSTYDLNIKIKDFYDSNIIVTLPNAYNDTCSNYWHPSGSMIVAFNGMTNTYDLLYPNGTKQLSFWGSLGWKAAFSPDGNRVVFLGGGRSNVLYFFNFIKNEDGIISGISQNPSDTVTVPLWGSEPFIADIEWAPDGNTLAIMVQHNWDLGDSDILLIQPDGSVVANLTNGFNRLNGKEQQYYAMRFSPTEKKLAFYVKNLSGSYLINPQVYVIDLYSGRIIELTGGDYPVGEMPSFSPDGKKIIFTAGPAFGHTIVMCNPDGTNKVALPIESSGFAATFRP